MAEPITDLRQLATAAGQANTALDDLERQALEAGVSVQKLGKLFRDVKGEANNLAAAGTRLGLSQQALTRYNRDGAAAFMANYNALIASERATRSLQKSNNKMGVAFNQASFQVNDFFVQMSSGTDVLVAFGQQGSQLAQILTMFGGGLAVFGASLSVAIPLLTSVARGMDLFGDQSAENIRYATREADKLVSGLKEVAGTRILAGLVSDFKELSGVISGIADRDLANLRRSLEKNLSESPLEIMGGMADVLGKLFTVDAKGLKEFTEARKEELDAREKVVDYITRAVERSDTLLSLEKEIERVQEKRDSAGLSGKMQEYLDRVIKGLTEELNTRTKVFNERQKSLDLLWEEYRLGADSIEYLKRKLEYERLSANESAKAKGLSGELLEDYKKLTKQEKELRLDIKKRADAEKLAKEQAEEAKRIKIETLGLEIKALRKLDLTAETKADILEKEMQRFMLQKGITAEVDKQTEAEKKLLAAKFATIDLETSGTRSGKKGGVKKAKADTLDREILNYDKLIAKTKVKAQFDEESWDYYSRMLVISNKDVDVNDKRLGQLRAQFEEHKRINEILEFRKELQDALVKSAYELGEGIGSAFAKMGEGKSTLDKIGIFIKEITKAFLATELAVLAFTSLLTALSVPKDIAGALAGQIVMAGSKALEFANGGVFDQGVQKFANGGIVSQPTYFNMGLMGEAGPEAIMPLKRGRDGKLGVAANDNGGAVTVVQNFSFSANGDDSVKKIIAQEAPKIAQMTKREIIDDRRRGGATRGAFA